MKRKDVTTVHEKCINWKWSEEGKEGIESIKNYWKGKALMFRNRVNV